MKFHIGSMLAAVAVAIGLAGCGDDKPGTSSSSTSPSRPGTVYNILAGSELKDVAPLVQQFGDSQGVKVNFTYTGTLDAVDTLSTQHNYDAAWVSHGKYLQLVPTVKGQVKASEKTMFSRVVLGVKPEVAAALGWKNGKVSWKDVIAASKAGKFRYAMTNPTGSNTGFVSLVGLATELSGKGDALQVADVQSDKLKALFAGQTMTSGSSGDLADAFKANPAKADGMINYESVIRSLANDGVALQVIVPKEGVITADYPLMQLASSQQAEFYGKLVEHLRSPTTQETIAKTTFRTPLTGSGSDEVVNELPFPGSVAVVDAILRGYLDSYSKPAKSHFVLDISGSMSGERLGLMKDAMRQLTLTQAQGSGRFSTFRSRELITVTPFADKIFETVAVQLDQDAKGNADKLTKLGRQVDALQVAGGTAIYEALAAIYPRAQQDLRAGDATVSIVLLTDGENRTGRNIDAFVQLTAGMGEPRVPVFGILFGEANENEMKTLASATGGRVFDARKDPLPKVMKIIRTYQ